MTGGRRAARAAVVGSAQLSTAISIRWATS